jgi:multidrug efflux system outer membrane protein
VFSKTSLLLLAVFLAGCATAPEGEAERPALPVPAAWNGAPVDGAQAAKIHWRQYFPDPALQTLIAQALDNNRDLRIAAARVEEARAQYGVSRAERLPSLGLTGSAALLGLPANSTQATSERFDVGVSMLSFEVDFWGRLAKLSEAARYNYLATEEARRWVHISLVGDVASAYFAWLQARDTTELARNTLALRQQSQQIIGKGKEGGVAFDLDFQNAVALEEGARSNLDGALHQETLALNRLNFLIGHASTDLPAAGSLQDQQLDASLAPGLASEVLLLRPDVAAAEQKLRAAHANIGAARAAFMPKVLLTATAGLASQGLGSLFNGLAWAFQPSITLPLFDGGRLSAGMELAEARKVVAIAEYERTIQLAFREVADLLSTRLVLSKQLQSALSSRTAQGKLLEIANARYGIGFSSYLEVLEAQRAFIGASQTVVQIRRAQLDAASQLYKALGGGGTV